MRIRYKYIDQSIFNLLQALPPDLLHYPLDLVNIIKQADNCKLWSYQHYARHNNINMQKVIDFCESESGCTHYCAGKQQYIILFNKSYDNNNVEGRQIFTLAHELGHVNLKHLPLTVESSMAENNFNNITSPVFEKEADYFAATLLAPLPLFKFLNIQSPSDIQKKFGLSTLASQYRFNDYLNWQKYHFKYAWDNKIIRLFKNRI